MLILLPLNVTVVMLRILSLIYLSPSDYISLSKRIIGPSVVGKEKTGKLSNSVINRNHTSVSICEGIAVLY